MRMINIFHELSQDCSRMTAARYSTSFFSAIRLLHKDLRAPICNIYGFVRFADEIVDTFHQYDKAALLAEFRKETLAAMERGISLNPILHSFQLTVNRYAISRQLINDFLHSMEMDITQQQYDSSLYAKYIHGSAEVVGLMCLSVFCDGDEELYGQLAPYAQSLGAAFQKVNFLRDIRADYEHLNRMYFPGCDFRNFTRTDKQAIEAEVQKDFEHAMEGIIRLPWKARFGVYVAYKYYYSLFNKIRKMQPQSILNERVRIPDHGKLLILAKAGIRKQLNLL